MGFIGTALAAFAKLSAPKQFFIRIAASVLLSTVSSKLFGPKTPKGVGLSSVQVTTAGGLEYRKIAYGRALVSGPIAYQNTAGPNGEELWTVVPMLQGRSEALEAIYLDNERIPVEDIDWTPGVGAVRGTGTGAVSTAKWVGENNTTAVFCYWHLGYTDQIVNADLNAAFSEIESSFRGRGVTYCVFKIVVNADTENVWKDGLPNDWKALFKARLVYDPRQDSTNGGSGTHRVNDSTTWEWSENPVLCNDDYLRTVMGVDPLTSIEYTSVIDAANDTGEAVSAPDPTPGPGSFLSDAIMWLDMGVELGSVPNTYGGYQMVQTWANHFNLHETCSMTFSAGTHEVIYAHPTLNDHATNEPPFLSSWTDTGETGTITIKDRDNNDISVTVRYYSRNLSGTFTWEWYATDIEDRLKYFVGCFLVPPAATISAVYPSVYTVVPSISAAYTPLGRHWVYDPSPSSVGSPDTTSTSWADLETDVEAASAGDIIKLTPGVYNDDGERTWNAAGGDIDNPVIVDISGCDLRGSTAAVWDACDGLRVWGGTETEGTGNTSMVRFTIENDSSYCRLENFFSDACSQDANDDSFTTLQVSGLMNGYSNCEWSGKNSRGNHVNFSPTTGDNDADQFCVFQYGDFDAFNVNDEITAGENAAYIRIGGNNNFEAKGHGLIRWNRFSNWHRTPNDAEFLVLKSCGTIVYQNVVVSNGANDSMSGLFVRTGAWNVVWGNYHDANSNNANTQAFNFQGMDDTSSAEYLDTDLIFGRHFCKDFDGVNGYMAANQKDPTSTNRWLAVNGLVCEVYLYNFVDQAIQFGDFSSSPIDPENLHMHAIALGSNTSAIVDEYSATNDTAVVSWEANIFDVSSLGTSPNPAGITLGNITWADRGDGSFVTQQALASLSYVPCWPGFMSGSTISNVGLTR